MPVAGMKSVVCGMKVDLYMEFITAFFGRFHPLVVHLPIGILFLAFFFECLSFSRRYRKLRKAVQPALFWGAVAAVVAAITGFFLRQEGGYEESLADRHQNFGILTAVLALVVYVLRPKVKYWIDHRYKQKRAKLALFVPLMVCLTLTGHWGGSLTHGEDYLFAVVTLQVGESKDPVEKIRTIADVEQAVYYRDVIQPILEARCYDCHSASKQKGDLRLDHREFIERGGKNGPVIVSGPADSSSLYKRLILPLEHEDHMPPNEKPQLSSSEIALIQYWIEDDASFEKPVANFVSEQKIAAIVRSLQAPSRESWIPTEEVRAADDETLRKLMQAGVNPMPVAEGSHHLMVTFTGKKEISDEQLNGLQDIANQLVWLNLSYSGITDAQLEKIAGLGNLRVLYLNYTGITDDGLSKLATLTGLRWLSLVGTNVTDASVPVLSRLAELDRLYVYQTDVTWEALEPLRASKDDLQIDTGHYQLKKLPTDTIIFTKKNSN